MRRSAFSSVSNRSTSSSLARPIRIRRFIHFCFFSGSNLAPCGSELAFATRALSALIGTLAVPLIFVFARRLTARPRVVWFAAIFAAISPLLIYYSQETRMYELVAVMALASTYFAARGDRRGDRLVAPTKLFASIGRRILSPLCLRCTRTTLRFFIVAAQNIFAMVRLRRESRRVDFGGSLVQIAIGVWHTSPGSSCKRRSCAARRARASTSGAGAASK